MFSCREKIDDETKIGGLALELLGLQSEIQNFEGSAGSECLILEFEKAMSALRKLQPSKPAKSKLSSAQKSYFAEHHEPPRIGTAELDPPFEGGLQLKTTAMQKQGGSLPLETILELPSSESEEVNLSRPRRRRRHRQK